MAQWILSGGVPRFAPLDQKEIQVVLDADGPTGNLSGTVSLNHGSMVFDVTGTWGAQGSIPGRNNNAFTVAGSTRDGLYVISLSGTCTGSDPIRFWAPSVITVSSLTGQAPPTEPTRWQTPKEVPLSKYFGGVLIAPYGGPAEGMSSDESP